MFFKESYRQISTPQEQNKFVDKFNLQVTIQKWLEKFLTSGKLHKQAPDFLHSFLGLLNSMYEYDNSDEPLIFTFESVFASVNMLIQPKNPWQISAMDLRVSYICMIFIQI